MKQATDYYVLRRGLSSEAAIQLLRGWANNRDVTFQLSDTQFICAADAELVMRMDGPESWEIVIIL